MRVATAKPPGAGSLITSGATTETKNLYKRILGLCGSPYWMPGVHERYDDLVLYPVPPTGRKPSQEFFNITGRYPAWCHYEWQAPSQATGSDGVTGATFYARMRADMIAAYQMGIAIGMHDLTGAPNFGTMSTRADSGAKNYVATDYIATVLTGQSNEAVLLAWLDELAAHFNTLIDPISGVKIPVLFRLFPEPNSRTFWYSGETRYANFVSMYQKSVAYLRDVKGVTNVIYVWCLNADQSSGNPYSGNGSYPYANWYPGDSYVDCISFDYYNDGAYSPSSRYNSSGTPVQASVTAFAALAAPAGKPMHFAEIGYKEMAGPSTIVWEQTGQEMSSLHRYCWGAGFWRPPFGPALGQASNASLAAMAASPYCLTLDKL